MIAAVVPVKSLDSSKSRLLPRLGADGARRLALAMLEDVLEALRAVPEIDIVSVTTPDVEVAAAADQTGVQVLLRHDPGRDPGELRQRQRQTPPRTLRAFRRRTARGTDAIASSGHR